MTNVRTRRIIHAIALLQLTKLRRQARRRFQSKVIAIHNLCRLAAIDSIPIDISLGLWQRSVDIQQSNLARSHHVVQIPILYPHRLVESGGSRSLEAAGAGKGLVDGLIDRQASTVGVVVGPEIFALIAHGKSPCARCLAYESEHVVGGC